MKKYLLLFLRIISYIICLCLILVLIFISRPTGIVDSPDEIEWGVSFSKNFAQEMGLNWQELYLKILNDLQATSIRLPIYWQDVEPIEDKFIFDDYDWMIKKAEEKSVKLVLVIGRKLPRWPECHIPKWADLYEEKIQQEKILNLIKRIVNKYKNLENLYAWQVENEPFLPFGICPKRDEDFLDKEIALVRALDDQHPIMLTDSGEIGTWLRAAKKADIFGSTLYRIIYKKPFGYIKYPLTPNFFWIKANLVHLFSPTKPIIISELQAEPWQPGTLYQSPLKEQSKSMDLEKFYNNIEYAEKVAFPEVYLWGVEWWYWLKTTENKPEIWEAAKKVIQN